MRILSFDPGVNLGYALTQITEDVPFEILNLSSGVLSFDPDLPITVRLLALKDSLSELIDTTKPDILAVEAVNRVFGGAKGANSDALYRIYGYLHEIAFEKDIAVIDLPITTVKSVFTTSGKSDKKAMIREASKVTGRSITNNNEADAIGIGHAFGALYKEAITESEKEKYTSDFRHDFATFARHLHATRNPKG